MRRNPAGTADGRERKAGGVKSEASALPCVFVRCAVTMQGSLSSLTTALFPERRPYIVTQLA